MRSSLVASLTLVSLLALHGQVSAAQDPLAPPGAEAGMVVPRELLVLFEPDQVNLPTDDRSRPGRRTSVDQVQFRDAALRQLFQAKGLVAVQRIGTDPRTWPVTGVPFKVRSLRRGEVPAPDEVVDMSSYYTLYFADSAVVPEVLQAARRSRGVVTADANHLLHKDADLIIDPPARALDDEFQASLDGWDRAATRSPVDLLRAMVGVRPSAMMSPFIPNDPLTVNNSNWGLNNTQVTWADVNAFEAWGRQRGNPSVRIAIFDNGIDRNNAEFAGKLVGEYNFVDGNADAAPDESESKPDHGTAVTAIAAGLNNNGFLSGGLCGGTPGNTGCGILFARAGVQTFWNTVWEYVTSENHVASAVDWAMSNGARVINNSWCVAVWNQPSTHNSFRNAYIAGATITASSGNVGSACDQSGAPPETDLHVPAVFGDIVMAVGGIDRFGARAQAGPSSPYTSKYGATMSVVSPSVSIPTAKLHSADPLYASGTSAAAPFVSGLAGLLFSESIARGLNTTLTSWDIRKIIEVTARDLETPGWDAHTGHGLIDADAALALLAPPNRLFTGSASPSTSGCYSRSGLYTQTFWWNYAVAFVKRCEVRKAVTFASQFQSVPKAWGRPVSAGGFTPSNPNSEVYWTGVVPGSVTTTGATLVTYAYETYSQSGTFLGWYPADPATLNFGYAVAGVEYPYVVGAGAPGIVTVKATYPLTAASSYPGTFAWERSDDGGNSYYSWASGANTQFVAYAGAYTADWRVTGTRSSWGDVAQSTAHTQVCIPQTTTCPGEPLAPRPLVTSRADDRSERLKEFGTGLRLRSEGAEGTTEWATYDPVGGAQPAVGGDRLQSLFGDIGARRELTFASGGRSIQLRFTPRPDPTDGRKSILVEGSGLRALSVVRVGLFADPDVGATAGSDRVVKRGDGRLIVTDAETPDAIGYRVDAPGVGGAPVTGLDEDAFEVVDDGGDVRFTVWTRVRADASGRFRVTFTQARGGSPEEVDARLTPALGGLEERPNSPQGFGLRQSAGGTAGMATAPSATTSAMTREEIRTRGLLGLVYSVPSAGTGRVSIRVFDAHGRLVRRLLDVAAEPGEHPVEWDAIDDRGNRVAPGVYTAVLKAGGERITRRLVVTR